jgi:hypothetical protein
MNKDQTSLCDGKNASHSHHLIGIYYDSLSDRDEYIYTNNCNLEKYLNYESFSKFDFCPYCGIKQ